MDVDEIFRIVITEYIEPLLYRYEFKKGGRGAYYNKNGDNIWRIVPFFGNSCRPVFATLNITVCVGFLSLAKFLRPFPHVKIHNIRYPCAMATDIDNLYPKDKRKDAFGWPFYGDTEIELFGEKITKEIKDYGLPFFEQYGTLDKVIVAWEKGETYNLGSRVNYYLSAAYWLRGERDRAVECIEKSISEYEIHDPLHFRYNFNEAENRRKFIQFLKQQKV